MSDDTTQQVEDTMDTAAPVPDDTEPRSSPIPVLRQFLVAVGMLVIVFGVTYFDDEETQPASSGSSVRVEKMLPPEARIQEKPIGAFEDIRIDAQSAIVWDVREQRVLFNKNADEVRPLASITKLMTALVAYELLDPNEMVTISGDAIRVEGNSGFSAGDTFSMQSLADITLIESSNDGAFALGEAAGNAAMPGADGKSVFVTAMNVMAEDLGLTATRFFNSTGLDISENEAGAYGTARDVAYLMEYLITKYPEAAALTTASSLRVHDASGRYHLAQNTNETVQGVDGLLASKTGYTLLSGGNLVIAANVGLNRPVVIAVLGSSTQGRFTDTLKLLEEARKYVTSEAAR